MQNNLSNQKENRKNESQIKKNWIANKNNERNKTFTDWNTKENA